MEESDNFLQSLLWLIDSKWLLNSNRKQFVVKGSLLLQAKAISNLPKEELIAKAMSNA